MEKANVDVATILSAATGVLKSSGLDDAMALTVAETLVQADMTGHHTHGLQLLPYYLNELETGGMAKSGNVQVVRDDGASFFWCAKRLPGAWVLRQAIETMIERSAKRPVVTASISECFHIGSLQTYLSTATDRGLVCIVSATDPSVASVAPFGGTEPILTSNPVAFGIPTSYEPILVDLCTSVTSNSAMMGHLNEGTRPKSECLLDNEGNATNDPQVLKTDPPGTIMPLGGEDFGYKGFGLGLVVEALTLALSGYGRNAGHRAYGEGVFLQIINPDYFAGRLVFEREMSNLVERCKNSRVPAGGAPVRMPGQRAQELHREARNSGVRVTASILSLLEPWISSSPCASH
ncbi:MAG TPA: Ldh family oxidoreductase [Woeseiaceae bacterium]|nr:Ldh family oxidoreductase [Woeseiaceae bacterium]